MSTITKEWLQQKIAEIEATRDDIPFGLDEDGNNTLAALKLALAGMETKHNSVIAEQLDHVLSGMDVTAHQRAVISCAVDRLNKNAELLQQSPQPLTTSERAELENYRNAQPDMNYQHLSELYHAQEKRLFKLAQRLKGPSFDKYAHSPSQAIDVLESAIFGEREDEDCRAAMLKCKADGNSPVIGIDLASEPDRSVEIRYFAPPGYVMVPVEPTMAMLDEFDSIIDYGAEDSKDAWSRLIAAAPQQENV